MEIRQLRYFNAVVEEGTVTGAARKLNMTQPPLTAQLHSLEEELGCSLFRHEGRRLYLTEAGHTFYQRSCAILGMCSATAAEMENFRSGNTGTLRIGVVSSVQGTLFMNWITHFADQHPSIRYEIYTSNTYHLLERLRMNQLDLAIVRTPFSAPDLEILPIRKESMVAAGLSSSFDPSRKSSMLEKNTISLRELAQYPLILYRRWEGILHSRFEAAGCIPQIRCCNDDAQTTLALAENGLGIGILPASAIYHLNNPRLTVLKIEDTALSTEIAILCKSKEQLPQVALLFWDMMESIERSF